MLGRLLISWLAVTAACVLVPDPDHCANQGGDATCVDLELGTYCTSCLRTNHGCVDNAPADDCRPIAATDTTSASSEPTSSSSDPSTDTTNDTTNDTGTPVCDPTCGTDAPYCVDAQCTTCADAGGDEFCAAQDPAAPQCHSAWGTCVACFADGSPACEPDESFCNDELACGGCTEHAQCPESACDLEMGRCMDDAPQLWVDNDTCGVKPMGTEQSPYCTIAEALALIGPADATSVIHVASGATYNEPIVWSDCASTRRLAILGTGSVDVAIAADPNVAEVRCANTLYLADVRLITGTATGIDCQHASLWVDDSVLADNFIGLDATGCRVHVRRTEILSSTSVGIRTNNDTDLWVASSIIGSGGTDDAASRAIDATTGTADIRFTTVAGNRGTGKRSLWCEGAVTGSVRNSIFAAAGGSSIGCSLLEFSNTAVDDAELAMQGTDNAYVLYSPSWFVDAIDDDSMDDDYRLVPDARPGALPQAYLEGGRWGLGDPRVDVDGQARAGFPGATETLGADALLDRTR